MSLKVMGIFQSGLAELNAVQSYASIKTSQKLLGVSNSYITDIQIKLYDLNQAPVRARYYSELFQTDALDIKAANAQFDTGTSIIIITYAVSITLLIVAGFCAISTVF